MSWLYGVAGVTGTEGTYPDRSILVPGGQKPPPPGGGAKRAPLRLRPLPAEAELAGRVRSPATLAAAPKPPEASPGAA